MTCRSSCRILLIRPGVVSSNQNQGKVAHLALLFLPRVVPSSISVKEPVEGPKKGLMHIPTACSNIKGKSAAYTDISSHIEGERWE